MYAEQQQQQRLTCLTPHTPSLARTLVYYGLRLTASLPDLSCD